MHKNQQGVTLIEILIAMALGASLLVGLVQIYQGNSNTSQLVGAFSRVQESGRIASELMSRDIRMADYWGCLTNKNAIANLLDTAHANYSSNVGDFNWLAGAAIDGIDDASSATVGGTNVVDGTDVLFLRSSSDACAGSGRPMDSGTPGDFYVSAGCEAGIDVGDIALVTSCAGGDLFSVTGIAGTGAANRRISHGTAACADDDSRCVRNSNASFSEQYGRSARLLKPVMTSYFLAPGTAGNNSLFMRKNGDAVIELVDGVEDMQVTYGQDTNDDGAVDKYSALPGVVDTDTILSVRVQLTVSDVQAVGSSEPDRRLRKTFTATSSIRNRTL